MTSHVVYLFYTSSNSSCWISYIHGKAGKAKWKIKGFSPVSVPKMHLQVLLQEATIEDAQVCPLSSFMHWSVSLAVYKRVLQTAGINSGKRTLHTSNHITMCLKWSVVLSNVLNSSICVCLTKISQIFTIQFVVNINNVLSFWRSACFG